MIPFLVKGNDGISGRKAKPRHGRLREAWESTHGLNSLFCLKYTTCNIYTASNLIEECAWREQSLKCVYIKNNYSAAPLFDLHIIIASTLMTGKFTTKLDLRWKLRNPDIANQL